jgi:rhomboid protease GluP
MLTVTNVLIAINVVAFLWEIGTGGLTTNEALLAHGALYGPAVVQGHQYWRIVSGAFLHGGWLHIGANMWALYQVGTLVERFLGGPRMLAIYVLSMIGSGAAVVIFSPDAVTVGASGAIFGLFGALVGIGLRLGKPGRGLVAQVIPIILINLVITWTVPNISAAAHVGGLITGFIVGLIAFEMRPRTPLAPAYAVEAPLESREPEENFETETETETEPAHET